MIPSHDDPREALRILVDSVTDYLEQQKAGGVQALAIGGIGIKSLQELARPLPKTDSTTAMPSQRPSPPAQPPAPFPRAPFVSVPVTPTPSNLAPPATEISMPSTPAKSTSPSQPSIAQAAKESAMAALRERVLVCQKCPHLASSRKSVVFGVGNIHSPLLFVGEAPGADEDEQGEPFVGKAGQLLTKMIVAMGLSRSEVFIANILKCRPDTPGLTAGNRKPTAEEMQTCMPHLLDQIGIIQPKVIVALGATAVEGLLGKTVGITKLRGNWQSFHNTPVMPTYHPAYLLRNQAISEKRKVWEDLLQVMNRLGMNITEKQRGYFLSAMG